MLTANQIIEEAARRAARTNEFNGRGVAGTGAIRKLRNEAALHRSLIDAWTSSGASSSEIADAIASRLTGTPHATPLCLKAPTCEACDSTGFVQVDDPAARPGSTYSAPCRACQGERRPA